MEKTDVRQRIVEILKSIEDMQGSSCKVDTAKHQLLLLLRDLED